MQYAPILAIYLSVSLVEPWDKDENSLKLRVELNPLQVEYPAQTQGIFGANLK